MKNETDYLRDIGEIRSLMERSSKFISLSGWAGIFAGIYALAGVYVAINYLHFNQHLLGVNFQKLFQHVKSIIMLYKPARSDTSI